MQAGKWRDNCLSFAILPAWPYSFRILYRLETVGELRRISRMLRPSWNTEIADREMKFPGGEGVALRNRP
jgi:hypothetical protein